MKRFLFLLACMAASVVMAADKFVIPISGLTNGVTGVSTSDMINGYIESVYIDQPGWYSYTSKVTLATAHGGAFLVVSNTADALYIPRIGACWTNGVAFGLTQSLERVFLAQDRVIATVTAYPSTNNAAVSHTNSITIRFDDK